MAGGRRVDDLRRGGRIAAAVTEAARTYQDSADQSIDAIFDDVESKFVDAWQADAGLMTYGEAVGSPPPSLRRPGPIRTAPINRSMRSSMTSSRSSSTHGRRTPG